MKAAACFAVALSSLLASAGCNLCPSCLGDSSPLYGGSVAPGGEYGDVVFEQSAGDELSSGDAYQWDE